MKRSFKEIVEFLRGLYHRRISPLVIVHYQIKMLARNVSSRDLYPSTLDRNTTLTVHVPTVVSNGIIIMMTVGTKQGSRVEHPADTHLNTCAVLSQVGRHQGALEHAQSALILLQEELFGGGAAMGGDGGREDQPPRADRIAVLAIAYHNMGVEQEFLKKFEHSLQSYRKGVEVSESRCRRPHSVCGLSKRVDRATVKYTVAAE